MNQTTAGVMETTNLKKDYLLEKNRINQGLHIRIASSKILTQDEVRLIIFDYIEVFYNRKRLHSKLGY